MPSSDLLISSNIVSSQIIPTIDQYGEVFYLKRYLIVF